MNILIVSDDGEAAVGLQVLQEAARFHFGPKAKIVTIVPEDTMGGKSFSITPNAKSLQEPYVPLKEIRPSVYQAKGTPIDCLYLGMLYPTHVLGTDSFDIVLSGVNRGHNVGVDVFHSGTVAVAMLAATVFGVASVAFSQEVPDEDDAEKSDKWANFQVAEVFTRKILSTHSFTPGSCLNVNFPAKSPKGFKKANPAPYSRWLPSTTATNDTTSDIRVVADGFIAVTDLELTVAPAMSY